MRVLLIKLETEKNEKNGTSTRMKWSMSIPGLRVAKMCIIFYHGVLMGFRNHVKDSQRSNTIL